jgi:FkbM family methyltransferase
MTASAAKPTVLARVTAAASDLGQAVTTGRSLVGHVWAHPANSRHRRAALLRFLSYQTGARLLGRRGVAQLGDRSKVWVDLHWTAAAAVLYANPPDFPEMMAWRCLLLPGDVFVDVGANIGTYTIWAAELGTEVIALEPSLEAFARLEENLRLNCYRARAIRAAAGANVCTARFSAGRGSANRLDPLGEEQTDVVTIDSLIGDRVVAGMKVDVEGYELEVLRGCARALAEHRIRMIQLEWNMASLTAVGTDRQPIADLLAGHGYRLCRPGPDGQMCPTTDIGYGPDMFACPAK